MKRTIRRSSMNDTPTLDYLRAHSNRDEATGCLRWAGARDANGYGRIKIGRRMIATHRVAYELAIGPIPDGLHVDHVWDRGCRHRDCLEPTHLEAVTVKVNNERGAKARQTHCVNGHEYTPENTRVRRNGTRNCKRCHADQEQRRVSASRAAATVAIVLAAAGIGALASAPPAAATDDITLYWSLPDGGTPSRVTWPQPARTDADCGGWWQADTGPREGADALTADGVLDYQEDWGWVTSWTFLQQPECVTESPTPTPEPTTPAPTPTETTPAPTPTETPTVATPTSEAPPVEARGSSPAEPVVAEVLTAAPDAELAETGVPAGFLALAGVVALAFGTVLVATRRKGQNR